MTDVVRFSDSFNRPNNGTSMGSTDSAWGGTAAVWTPLSGVWGIYGGRAVMGDGTAQAVTVIETGLADCTIELYFDRLAFDQGLAYRAVDDNNYFLITNGGGWYRKQAGSYNVIGSPGTFADLDRVTVVVSGNTHTVYKNGVQVGTTTDSFQNTATKHGLRSNLTQGTFDDFKVSSPAVVQSGLGFPTASHGGNLIVNPGSSTPGSLQTYLRESRWWALQMSPFTLGMPPLRSGGDDNAVIPGETGRYAFARVLDQGTYVTSIKVTGECGASGIAPTGTDPTRFLTQLRANRTHLLTNVHTPVGVTRTARLVLPDASTVDFAAQFALTLVDQKIAIASFMLDVVVPAGLI